MLSHTLQNTWNFSVLVRALPTQHVLITLMICALEVIMVSCVDELIIDPPTAPQEPDVDTYQGGCRGWNHRSGSGMHGPW
jgi:hypothetical protein